MQLLDPMVIRIPRAFLAFLYVLSFAGGVALVIAALR
jgi:hypothetical protein